MTQESQNSLELQQLSEIRQEIDAIDEQIQTLISARAKCAQKVADIKTQGGKVEAVFYRPEREAQVLRAVKERNQSLLADDDMARIFREIMSVCLALEQPVKVAYLGPEGSYSHAATLKQFGSFSRPMPVSTIDDVFKSVSSGEANFGVVPVENSTEGVVSITQINLLQTELKITGEVDLAIHHCLLSKVNDLSQVKKVVAHAQALAQTRKWLENNLPGVEIEAVESNALAAQMAQKTAQPGLAAIASEQAAVLYDLNVLRRSIEDSSSNTTRFWVLGKDATVASGEDKTSLVISMPNRAGALFNVLASFAKREISMTRIVSRPAENKKWDYVFFIDILGHQTEENVAAALAEVEQLSSFYKVLGSYPISPLV